MLKKFLEAGEIVGTHGLKGEMRFQPWCDSVDFLKKFQYLYFEENPDKFLEIRSVRAQGNVALLSAEGIDTIDQAAAMRGKVLYIKRSDTDLKEGDYFISELIGCRVVDASDENKSYGILSDVSKTGANDVWHIQGADNKEYLIPAIPDVVDSVDVVEGIIKIRPLRGIFDDED